MEQDKMKPLFPTDDGVIIYEGNTYWIVSAWDSHKNLKIITEKTATCGEIPSRNEIVLSTREAAIDYVTK